MNDTTWQPSRTIGVYTRRSGEMTLIEGYIDAYETNHVGAYIWSLCGSELNVGDIGVAVAEHYGISIERAAAAVEVFLEELRARGFVS